MRKISLETKIRIVLLYVDGIKSAKEICSTHDLPPRTFRRWVGTYKTKGAAELQSKRPGPPKGANSIPAKLQQRITHLKQKHLSWGARRITHGFTLQCDVTKKHSNLQVNWDKGNKFHMTGLTSALCTDDPTIDPGQPAASFDTYFGNGVGRLNGESGATIKFTFTDAGEPGKNDHAKITIKDSSGNTVLSVSGNIKGNHQAHK